MTHTGPNLDLLCVQQLDTYFDAKHLKKDRIGGGEIFGAHFLQRMELIGQYQMLPYFSRLGPARFSFVFT